MRVEIKIICFAVLTLVGRCLEKIFSKNGRYILEDWPQHDVIVENVLAKQLPGHAVFIVCRK